MPDRKLLGSLWGPEDSSEDLPLPCPADPAGLIDCKHARLRFRPSAAVRPYSPDEEDVLVADVCVSSLPSTGLSRVTSSAPTMQQQRADNSSKTQGATPKDSPLHGESASQTVVVSADNSDAMDVQSSGGPVNTAKRGPPVNVLPQDVIASEQPAKKGISSSRTKTPKRSTASPKQSRVWYQEASLSAAPAPCLKDQR
ncbi:hypothetical protein MTO96_034456 [Rhipicephalus appendiculatus]